MTTINAHDYTSGEVLTAATLDGVTADLNTLLTEVEGSCYIEQGQYTGDGSVDKTVTLTDTEMVVKGLIVFDASADGVGINFFFSTDLYVDDDADGLALQLGSGGGVQGLDNRIKSIGTGNFHVDDDGADLDPNKNGVTYNYIVWGTH